MRCHVKIAVTSEKGKDIVRRFSGWNEERLLFTKRRGDFHEDSRADAGCEAVSRATHVSSVSGVMRNTEETRNLRFIDRCSA